MFQKTDFQKAMATLAKAEAEVARRRRIVEQTDQAIDRAIEEHAAADRNALLAMDGKESVSEVEEQLDAISMQRDRMTRRIDEYQRLRANQVVNVRRAQLDVLEAERAVQAAQGSYFRAAFSGALERCVKQCRDPLIELQRVAAAAAYHEKLPYGAREARVAWYGASAIALLEAALTEGDAPFDAGIAIDESTKGVPPVIAVSSGEVTEKERAEIIRLQAAGCLTAEKLTASLSVAERPKPEQKEDERYSPGVQVQYWQGIAEKIEREMDYERTREYPDMSDGRPVSVAALRKRALDVLEMKLAHARTCAANWQAKIDAPRAA